MNAIDDAYRKQEAARKAAPSYADHYNTMVGIWFELKKLLLEGAESTLPSHYNWIQFSNNERVVGWQLYHDSDSNIYVYLLSDGRVVNTDFKAQNPVEYIIRRTAGKPPMQVGSDGLISFSLLKFLCLYALSSSSTFNPNISQQQWKQWRNMLDAIPTYINY